MLGPIDEGGLCTYFARSLCKTHLLILRHLAACRTPTRDGSKLLTHNAINQWPVLLITLIAKACGGQKTGLVQLLLLSWLFVPSSQQVMKADISDIGSVRDRARCSDDKSSLFDGRLRFALMWRVSIPLVRAPKTERGRRINVVSTSSAQGQRTKKADLAAMDPGAREMWKASMSTELRSIWERWTRYLISLHQLFARQVGAYCQRPFVMCLWTLDGVLQHNLVANASRNTTICMYSAYAVVALKGYGGVGSLAPASSSS